MHSSNDFYTSILTDSFACALPNCNTVADIAWEVQRLSGITGTKDWTICSFRNADGLDPQSALYSARRVVHALIPSTVHSPATAFQ